MDELALLVRGFNQMTEELEANSRELDRRRRFTEAILESIPTGVISIGADGPIQRVNQALCARSSRPTQVASATRLEDLFSREDTAEIKYLMKRARRTGLASRQLELRTDSRKLHLAVTVSALEEKLTSGFVVVLEDTSELLRAQKAAAWHEVARRVAHEIKNPLTPIALSAERIGRQLDRLDLPPANGAHPARVRRHHRQIGGIGEDAGGRVLAVRALPRGAARALRSERSGGEAPGRLRRPAGRHRDPHQLRARPAAGEPGPRAVPARGGEPGGQRRRSHAGFAGEAAATSPRSPAPRRRWNWWWPIPAAASRRTTRRNCSCLTFRPRTAAPAWAWRSSTTSSPSTTRTSGWRTTSPRARASPWRFRRCWSRRAASRRSTARPWRSA